VTKAYPLNKAPIKEALIDIQVNGDNVDIQSLNMSLDGFPSPSEIRIAMLQFQAGPDGAKSTGGEPTCIGYRYESEDGEFIVQLRQDGMTVSRLAPYTTWEDLFLLAQKIWPQYQEATKQAGVNRLAVRYINSLNIPFPENDTVDFNLYLSNAPRLTFQAGEELDHFLTRLVLSLTSPAGATAIINQTIEPQSEDFLPLILDIDIFLKFEQDPPIDDKIWRILELMRDAKNTIFFNTMTKSALELCT